MAIPIINTWQNYYPEAHEGMGSSYERIVLNLLLSSLHTKYGFANVLESPCFGFTGITGINLVQLAKAGCKVHLEDSDPLRIELIQNSWQDLGLPVSIKLNRDFTQLDYKDHSFDFAFNFSAMWFVKDLSSFISELCRVTRGPILICVPNQEGLGFRGQLQGYSPQEYPQLRPSHIDPHSIIYLMQKQGRTLQSRNYIDCPPWPDIGMNKEDYIKKILPAVAFTPRTRTKPAQSIMPYYRGEDPTFANRMLRLYPFEKLLPHGLKRFWAHHRYMLFVP